MGIGLQTYLKLEARVDALEAQVSPGNFKPHEGVPTPGDVILKDGRPIVTKADGTAETNDGPGTASYKVKAPQGNPNIDYRARHKGGGVWHVIREGVPMAGEKMTKNEAYDKAESLTQGG
mgnify:CR=1 FL=1